jgi:hypothetical protein
MWVGCWHAARAADRWDGIANAGFRRSSSLGIRGVTRRNSLPASWMMPGSPIGCRLTIPLWGSPSPRLRRCGFFTEMRPRRGTCWTSTTSTHRVSRGRAAPTILRLGEPLDRRVLTQAQRLWQSTLPSGWNLVVAPRVCPSVRGHCRFWRAWASPASEERCLRSGRYLPSKRALQRWRWF